MQAAEGILTAFGGCPATRPWSAGRWARSASSAATRCKIDYDTGTMRVVGRDTVLKEGDCISIDGFTGEVIAGQIATKPSEVVAGARSTRRSSPSSRTSTSSYAS